MDSASPKWRSEKIEIWKVEFGVVFRGELNGRIGIARARIGSGFERRRRRVGTNMVGGRSVRWV